MLAKRETVTIRGAEDGEIGAELDRPEREPVAYALFAHCFAAGSKGRAGRRIGERLAEAGVAVLRLDITRLASGTGPASPVVDVIAAADVLRDRFRGPNLLLGHGIGGTAVLAAASRVPEAKAVATINAPLDAEAMKGMIEDSSSRMAGVVNFKVGDGRFAVRRTFLKEVRAEAMREALPRMRKPLLIMHSPLDGTVGVENARAIFDGAKHPISFVSLDRADHLLSAPRDAELAACMLVAWVGHYVTGVGRREPFKVDLDDARHAVLVREVGGGTYVQAISDGRHAFGADEPADRGGLDLAPNPLELLIAGLGACTAITMRAYANRKKWPVDGISVTVRHTPVDPADYPDHRSSGGRLDRFERIIELEGALSAEQRARLLEIADRCPVHTALHNDNVILTRLAEGRRADRTDG